MRTVLMTGATSFIGRHMLTHLLRAGVQVTAIVRPDSPYNVYLPQHLLLNVLPLPLDDVETLPARLRVSPDTIIHLAWDGTRMPQREDDALQAWNTKRSLQLIDIGVEVGVNVFMGAGSQAEYGYGGVLREDSPTHPSNAYGKAKLAVCQEGASRCKAQGLRFVWPRIFSLYGRGDAAGTLVSVCLDKMQQNEDVLLSPCTQMWDFLYIQDAVAALIMLLENDEAAGVYNLASGKARPLYEFVEEMARAVGTSSRLLFGTLPLGNNPEGFMPAVEKIMACVEWRPTTPFAEGIRKML